MRARSIALRGGVVMPIGIMIHIADQTRLRRNFGVLAATLALSACAGSGADYPSFATPTPAEEAGRVSMSFPAVTVPEFERATPPAQPLPTELDARLAAINTRALAAANAFTSGYSAARALAGAAGSSAPESDTWSSAQLRVADLASHHSATQLALADLDALSVTAQLNTGTEQEASMIHELQESLGKTINEQARMLNSIDAQLNR